MAPRQYLAAALAVIPLVASQQVDTSSPEAPPSFPTWKCTTAGGCVQQDTSLVVDWNYHWIHQIGTSQSCTTSSGVNSTLCGTEAACYQNCEIAGANYTGLGIDVSGSSVTLHQYLESDGTWSNASPRAYLLGSDQDYVMLQLLNQEISFTVDVSNLPCGENGALYLSQMDKTGGRNQYNPGAAEYGSGYCDAQCPVQTWRNGTLNTNGAGYCCNEMDLWEANSQANAFTPHPCSSSACDGSGCGFNAYAQGDQSYYGPGLTVNTNQPFTVVTQFISSDGTSSGTLSEIRRLYVQNGKVIPNAVSSSGVDSITESWCTSQDGAAATYGGLTTMGQGLEAGMVLVFSIWNDNSQSMNWLDSGSAGPCSSTAGNPSTILANDPSTSVTFSNIKWGDLNTTYTGGTTTTTTSTHTTTTTSSQSKSSSSTTTTTHTTTTTIRTTTTTANGATQTHWGQCGGIGYGGPTACASPYTCQEQNPYYSQCL